MEIFHISNEIEKKIYNLFLINVLREATFFIKRTFDLVILSDTKYEIEYFFEQSFS